ncbi:MAG: ATP-dependent Zn protease [Cyanobacteriota bacterium]|nr:ATP-dependent Zn protease [Cyanobacteriota bacterium]
MNQTSLNLIAITIFTLTLSALVGPMVHLSPLVPAGLAFLLLVLGTIDTFALQGQGSAILVESIEGISPEKRDRIVRHEAGHFLVAYLMDIPIQGYALNTLEAFRQGQRASGGVQFNDTELLGQLQKGQLSTQIIDQYCTVWMAGIAAETLAYENAEGGAEDRGKIRAVWTQLKRPLSEATIKERWATLQAQTLIEQNHSAYEALVEAMKQHISVEECCQMLKKTLKVSS